MLADLNFRKRFTNRYFLDNMTIYPNDDEIKIVHVDNRHTDGDSIVYFTKNNVIHVGDDFNEKSYPFIVIPSGCSIVHST